MNSLGAAPRGLSDTQRACQTRSPARAEQASPTQRGAEQAPPTQQGEGEQAPPTLAGGALPHGLLVVGDTAVNDRLLAGVHDDERQVDDRVGRGRPAGLLLHLAVPLHQVLEGDLLKKTHNGPALMPAATEQLASPWASATALPSPSQHREGWSPERPGEARPEPSAWRAAPRRRPNLQDELLKLRLLLLYPFQPPLSLHLHRPNTTSEP